MKRNFASGFVGDRLLALLIAAALDLCIGEPPEALHPVVWLGAAIDALDRRKPTAGRNESLVYGAIATLGLTAGSGIIALGAATALRTAPRPVRVIALACLLKPAFAFRGLIAAGSDVRHALDAADLHAARVALQCLVSRDPSRLSENECAAASVESLAENITDSFAGPWLAFLAFGLPGAWVFRTVNTLDSRWGYHGPLEWLGRTAAVFDDTLAAVPARLSAILLIAAAGLTGANAGGAARVLIDDRRRTPSPNAGWTMAAMAGALGRRLTKTNVYTLNARGSDCSADDVMRAQRLVALCAGLFLAIAATASTLVRRGKS